MTPMRWFYAAFWLLVATMLFLQFQSYNKHIDQAVAAAGPKQQHYFFLDGSTNGATAAAAPSQPQPDGAIIKQVGFSVENNVPAQGSFTCHVALKNEGNMKAIGVSVQVSPYRGAWMGNGDNDNAPRYHLDDNDPVSQINQWVSAPDIAPGETKIVDAVFTANRGYWTGSNPYPQIIFHNEKPNSAP